MEWGMILLWSLFSIFIVLPMLALVWSIFIHFKNIFLQGEPLAAMKNMCLEYKLECIDDQPSLDGYEGELEYAKTNRAGGNLVIFNSFSVMLAAKGTIGKRHIEIDAFRRTWNATLLGRGRASYEFTTRVSIDGKKSYINLSYKPRHDTRYGDKGYAPADFIKKILDEIRDNGSSASISEEADIPQNKALFVTLGYICVRA